MAVFAEEDRKRLFDFMVASMDEDNAATMDAFAQNFLHNGKVWDLLAEHFPTASPSAVKAIMLDAYASRKSAV
ncbi:hypothetical protein A6A04_05330 [Paramagnetospirillum marisnigri]|uniref:Uncharacterized protein n=1 Tax=Paramagnetospirillum marisnigri TaxID=1285242 RepID=A0A178MJI6_9PROT|nr:hypothetical protein [Paramagnetospirillum marisnigri]OAN48174.1 hypothetical protein A6A04_05330 [Paramagnetospirillum marisnigri]